MGQWGFHTSLLSTRSCGAKIKNLRYSHNLPNKSTYSFLEFHVDPISGNKSLKKHRARRRKASVKHCVLQTSREKLMGKIKTPASQSHAWVQILDFTPTSGCIIPN